MEWVREFIATGYVRCAQYLYPTLVMWDTPAIILPFALVDELFLALINAVNVLFVSSRITASQCCS
jgi:hypothetical protein